MLAAAATPSAASSPLSAYIRMPDVDRALACVTRSGPGAIVKPFRAR